MLLLSLVRMEQVTQKKRQAKEPSLETMLKEEREFILKIELTIVRFRPSNLF